MGYISSGASISVDGNTTKLNTAQQIVVQATAPITNTSGIGLAYDNSTLTLNGSNQLQLQTAPVSSGLLSAILSYS